MVKPINEIPVEEFFYPTTQKNTNSTKGHNWTLLSILSAIGQAISETISELFSCAVIRLFGSSTKPTMADLKQKNVTIQPALIKDLRDSAKVCLVQLRDILKVPKEQKTFGMITKIKGLIEDLKAARQGLNKANQPLAALDKAINSIEIEAEKQGIYQRS